MYKSDSEKLFKNAHIKSSISELSNLAKQRILENPGKISEEFVITNN